MEAFALVNRPLKNDTHAKHASDWNALWSGSADSFCAQYTGPRFDPMRPPEPVVCMFICQIAKKCTRSPVSLKRLMGSLRGHWHYKMNLAGEVDEDDEANPFCGRAIKDVLHACQRNLRPLGAEKNTVIVPIRPSVAYAIKVSAEEVLVKLTSRGKLTDERRDELAKTLRACVAVLFEYSFAPRAIDATRIVYGVHISAGEGVRDKTERESTVKYYYDGDKMNNPRFSSGRSFYSPDVTQMPVGSAWTKAFRRLLVGYKKVREDIYGADMLVDIPLFFFPGETIKVDRKKHEHVTDWVRLAWGSIPGGLNLASDEAATSKSPRKGCASSFHYVHGDAALTELRSWGGWTKDSRIPVGNYINHNAWDPKVERKPAEYFFGDHIRSWIGGRGK